MNTGNRSHLFSRNYDAVIAALAGFIIIYLFTRHSGIGVSPDSVVYSTTANNFAMHGSLTDFNGDAVSDFPAFYPLFLSAFTFLTRQNPILFAPLLNGLLFALLIYVSGWIMERFSFRSKWYKWMLLSCIVFSPCLLEVYSMLWSETLFLLLLLLFFIAMRRYFETPSFPALLLAAGIAALACVTRYAGITLVGAGGLLLLFDRRLPFGKKMVRIFLFGLAGISLLVINLVRNSMVIGNLTGAREKALTSFGRNIYNYGSVFCDWLPVFNHNNTLASLVAWLLIAGFIIALLWYSFRSTAFYSYENMITVFFVVYTVFIIVSATISRYETINSRLLSPLFLPMLWGIGSWLTPLISKLTGSKQRWIIATGILFAACFQLNQLLAGYETWDGVKDAGIPGYTEDPWQQSETVHFIRQNRQLFQPACPIYSNANDGLYFLTGIHSDLLPHYEHTKEVSDFFTGNHYYVIWFNDGEKAELINMQDILTRKKINWSRQFNDGAVYFVDGVAGK